MTALQIITLIFIAGLVVALFPHKAVRPLAEGISLVAGILVIIFQQVLEITGIGVFFYPIATAFVAVALFLELKNSKASKGAEEAQQEIVTSLNAENTRLSTEKVQLEVEVERLKSENSSLQKTNAEYEVFKKMLGDDPLSRINELLKK